MRPPPSLAAIRADSPLRAAANDPQRATIAASRTDAGAAVGGHATTWRGRRVPLKHVLSFTEHLHTLLEAGLPLDRALHLGMSSVDDARLNQVMQAVVVDVEKGQSLAVALERQALAFPRLYVNMVKAGEEGGVLPVVLKRLVEFYTRSMEFRSFLVTSSIYPALLFVFGLAALLGLTVFVLPKFGQIFADMRQGLPLPATILIGVGEFMRQWGWALALGVLAFAITVWLMLKQAYWREKWQIAVLRLPILGSLLLKVQLSHVCRTWGTLLASGVPILTGLRIVRELTENIPLRNALDRLSRSVQEGRGVAAPMLADAFFPRLMGQLATVGEESGALDSMLVKLADQYERDVQKAARNLVALFEPVMILVMGGLIGVIVVSMLSAIFSINDMPL